MKFSRMISLILVPAAGISSETSSILLDNLGCVSPSALVFRRYEMLTFSSRFSRSRDGGGASPVRKTSFIGIREGRRLGSCRKGLPREGEDGVGCPRREAEDLQSGARNQSGRGGLLPHDGGQGPQRLEKYPRGDILLR